MAVLQIVYAPHPIFKMKAEKVSSVDEDIKFLADSMLETIYFERAIGIGANMVGALKQIAVVDIQENGVKTPRVFINPEITWYSSETQKFEEASLSFPGIAAEITRPRAIKVKFLNYEGKEQEEEYEDFLASVIQHEIDYLNGKIFLDYLSKMKRDLLIKKMEKYLKAHPPHIHSSSCHH